MWDCPIELQTTALEMRVREEENRMIAEAVRQIGVRIDEEGLLGALNHDRKRYEEAYQKGWNDCKEFYAEKCQKIADTLAEMLEGQRNDSEEM